MHCGQKILVDFYLPVSTLTGKRPNLIPCQIFCLDFTYCEEKYVSEHTIVKLDQPSSNLDRCKSGNGMVATQNKQQVIQSLGSYSQEEK